MVDKEEINYECGYPGCGKKFKQSVGTSSGNKYSKVTDQAVCPKCGNFLKSK